MSLDPDDVPYPTSRLRVNALRVLALGLGVLLTLVLIMAIAA